MAVLKVQDVSLRFGGIVALDGLSLEIEPGQICGLIGPNGAGKTSLFNCISRAYRPTSGTITLDGADLLACPPHRVASRGVARTFQNLGLFPSMTFLENTMAGAHPYGRAGFVRSLLRWGVAREDRAMRADAFELLERLGLGDLAFEQAADQPYGTLKRLELARALAARPKLLMLDEPAGGLTQAEVHELGEVIVAVRDEPISSLASFWRRVWASGPAGSEVVLQIMRDKEPMKVRIPSVDRTRLLKAPKLH